MKIVALALVAACAGGKMVAPKAPHFRVQIGDTTAFDLETTTAVTIGTTFRVTGDVSADCERDATKFGDKHDRTAYYACDEEPVTLAVDCSGPCTVSGHDITATTPGAITVQSALISTKTGKRYTIARTLQVVPPDGLAIVESSTSRCAVFRTEGDTIRCVLSDARTASVRLVEPLGPLSSHQLVIAGRGFQPHTTLELGPYVEQAGGKPARIEIVRNAFRRTIIVEPPSTLD